MIKKTRAHELAKELDVDWKILRDKGKPLGIDIITHQTMISTDDESKLRASFASAAKSAASTSSSTSSSGGRVVIRRRKAEADDPVTGADPTPVEEPVVLVEPVVAIAKQSPIVTKQADPVPVEKVIASPELKVEVASTPKVDKIEPETTQVLEVLSAKASEESAVSLEKMPLQTESKPAPAEIVSEPVVEAPKKRPPSVGGATIVRRASPEEIEAQQAAAAKEASLQANRTSRKEDNRGVRVSGMGLLSRNRPQNAGSNAPQENSSRGGFLPSASAGGEFPTTTTPVDEWQYKKIKSTREEEQSDEEKRLSGKLVKQKRTSGSTNMRALLEQFEDLEAEVPGTPGVEEAPTRVFTPSSHRRKDPRRKKDNKKTQITTPRARYRVIEIDGSVTVGELAHQMSIKATEVIKKLMSLGMMATMNQDLDLDTATLVTQEFGFEISNKETKIEDILTHGISVQNDSETSTRPPIVTIMGHVDHGKTSLLDAIRKANVASGEAGGITQHIGAYTVDFKDQRIAFLDTPGHEAFSSMRSRGASLTDIVVLVVAADDGVMPQTIEAINHAKAAEVPIIVAVNKIDKPGHQLDRLFAQLAEHGIQSEEWGGDNQFVKTSALQKIGISDLLDAILLQSEVLDLKSATEGFATGTVIEAHLDKGRGPIATVMVQSGRLDVGQYLVAGLEFGRVRAMLDHNGKKVDQVGPSTPVEIIGLSGVPLAGDFVNIVESERKCREVIAFRQAKIRKTTETKSSAASLADLLAKVQNSERPEVAVIVKADVQGSLEAVCEAVSKLSSPRVSNRIVHKAVGGISDSDLSLAQATNAVVLGFNVRTARGLDDQAEKSGIVIKYFSIIYELVDAMKSIMAGKLPPIVTEQVLGHAEVRQTISVPKVGTVAGSAVLDGKITRQSSLRVVRDNVVIYTGRISSLKRFKDDVREVVQGYECGISIDGYQDVRVGDVIEAFVFEESAPSL